MSRQFVIHGSAIGFFFLALICIIVGLMWPFRTIEPVRENRETFRMGDFFSLGALMIPCMSVVARQYSIQRDTEVAAVTLGVLLLISLLFWGGLCQWLSRRGIYQSSKRFLFVSFCIPGTLVLAIVGPYLIMFSVTEDTVGSLDFDWRAIEYVARLLGVGLTCAAIFWLNTWIARVPGDSAESSGARLKNLKKTISGNGDDGVLPWDI